VTGPTVLVLTGHYLPGFKYGGPVRTLGSVIERLGDEFQFRVVTSDRDLGDREAYPGVPVREWRPVGKGLVYYLPPADQNLSGLRSVMRKTPHDLLYLNSLFSPRYTLLPLLLMRLRAVPACPVLLAPRGELAAGALAVKSPKKRLFLLVALLTGLYRHVVWQASSEHEERDIRRVFGERARIRIAANLPSPADGEAVWPQRPPKQRGRLRAVYLGRVAVNKNLAGALQVLQQVKPIEGEVELDIYGPLEDAAYWRRCQALIDELPPGCRVQHRGVIEPERVLSVLRGYDLLLLPTHGENFGQAIFESLLAGCPVLISDRTPWRGLAEQGVGWDVPLERPERFAAVIEACIAMDEVTHRTHRERARTFALEFGADPRLTARSRDMFHDVIAG
jgi:glycosyltransferase involved in cell wall biosynthesis